MTRLHEVNVEMLSLTELHALALDVAAELEKRGEDCPSWLAGYEAGERSAEGCPCGDPDC